MPEGGGAEAEAGWEGGADDEATDRSGYGGSIGRDRCADDSGDCGPGVDEAGGRRRIDGDLEGRGGRGGGDGSDGGSAGGTSGEDSEQAAGREGAQ